MSVARVLQHCRILAAGPSPHEIEHAAPLVHRDVCQVLLPAEVVVDHPFAPEVLCGVQIQLDSAPGRHDRCGTGRRWVETVPAEAGKKYFDPGMSILGANDEVAGQVVPLTAAKSCDDPRWNANLPKHDRH